MKKNWLKDSCNTDDSAIGSHYRQTSGRSDHIRAGKTFMPLRFGAAQGGLAPCQQTFSGNIAGARCAITAPKFSQCFLSFSKLLVVVLGRVSVDEMVSV